MTLEYLLIIIIIVGILLALFLTYRWRMMIIGRKKTYRLSDLPKAALKKSTDATHPGYSLFADASFELFYQVAQTLEKDFGVTFHKKLDDFDTLYWDFYFNNASLTLHYNNYLGISLDTTPGSAQADENELTILASQLCEKLNEKR